MPRRTGQDTKMVKTILDVTERLVDLRLEYTRLSNSMEARKTQLQAQAAEIDTLKAEVAQLKTRVEVKP